MIKIRRFINKCRNVHRIICEMLQSPLLLGTSSRSWSWRVWWEKVWVLRLHLVLAFPSELWASFRFPTNLNDRNTTALEFLDSSVNNLDGFLDNVHAFIDLHILKRNMKVLIC